MQERSLQDVRRKFVQLMRTDPPSRAPLDPQFDRWMAARFSSEELQAVIRLEREYGERALAEWFAEIALEVGLRSTATH
jgi:uncharacterized protein (DUF2236 family)